MIAASRFVVAAALVVAMGCGSNPPPTPSDSLPSDEASMARVQQLFAERTGGDTGAASRYTIARGDRIVITVAGADEVSGGYTVASDGHVSLPLVGAIMASGETTETLAKRVGDRLEEQYLQSPRVFVAVENYQGRQVAVQGAVRSPNFYPITRGDETIYEMLLVAGGIRSDASPRLLFVPASDNAAARQMASATGMQSPKDLFGNAQPPIIIELDPLYEGKAVPALQMPVRGGDSIMVQEGGDVFVGGWVEKPGRYPLQRGMTVRQVIARAGGLHYAAWRGNLEISRKSRDGHRKTFDVSFSDIESGSMADVELEPGDRIEISANPLKATAWGIYRVATGIISIGVGGSVRVF